jgi:hypothetical protein
MMGRLKHEQEQLFYEFRLVKHAVGGHLTPAPRVALDARDWVGRSHGRKAWMQREQWFVWIAAAVVVTMVLAAAISGYMGRWWDFL